MGELHLEVIVHRLSDEFHLEVTVGAPRVAYREAVAAAGRGSAAIDRILGGKPIHGSVSLELLPDSDPGPPRLEWDADCPIPAAFRPAVEEALNGGAQSGPRFGFPLVQAVVRITGGGSSPAKDSDMGFSQAASIALREAMAKARIELLEPVMAFEIRAPAEFMSGILAELNSCRAEIGDLLVDGGDRTVVGRVPLANMFGYSTTLRSLSQGRADFSLSPAGFGPVPEAELSARGLVWQ
jgi:elongation factor G